jgi:hypothetical protein
MVKIAYLVLAHQQPNHCRRLLERLVSDSTRLFVHVDCKSNLNDFVWTHPNVVFLRDRLNVNRGGWSLTRAMVRALRTAFLTSDSEYFIFLAGTDYPIKSRKYISSFLSDKYPLNFLNYYPLLPGSYGAANLARYHFVDQSHRSGNILARPIGGLLAWIADVLPPRSFPEGSVAFRGSDRWCLNRETVAHVLDCWDSSKGRSYRKYFKYTWGSDEMFFQTVVLNSKWSQQCNLYDDEAVSKMIEGRMRPWSDQVMAHFHYIDWDPSREDPAILDERDLQRLERTEALFACKFHEQRSAQLLALLDQRLF